VLAQQDELSLYQFNSNQPLFKLWTVSQLGRSAPPHSASKACFTADLSFTEIHVDAWAGNVMAGAWGTAGPAPDVTNLQVKQ
jgi:hypothetical protein